MADSEVWLNVFEKLDQQNKLTLSRTFSPWHECVASKRTQFLFHEMIPILTENLPQTSLLQCRELCESYKNELDAQLQDHAAYLKDIIDYPPFFDEPNNSTVFNADNKIQDFLEEMKKHPGNPFPGRHLIFDSYFLDDNGQIPINDRLLVEYWRNVKELVERFGTHVYYVNIERWKPESDLLIPDCLNGIGKVLRQLPALKGLYFQGFVYLSDFVESGLNDHFKTHPWPRLEQLEIVKFNSVQTLVMNIVLNSCVVPVTLKALIVEECLWPSSVLRSETVLNATNLETLLINHVYTEDFEEFFNRASFLPPLKTVKLHFDSEDTPTYQTVFNSLQVFGETLEYLSIAARNEVVNIINLPNLRKLYLDEYTGSLQLFRDMKVLTHLEILHPEIYEYPAINNYHKEPINSVYFSNIWELIPSLQILRVHLTEYERSTTCKKF